MKFYEARCTIRAARSRVWKVLTDEKLLVRGQLGITRIEGTIGPGEVIKIWSEVGPQRAFGLRVSEFIPDRNMTWTGGMPLGLFRGTRRFTLNTVGEGTEFHMREEFSGPMLGLIWRSMPDLAPSFEKFAVGLKTLVEGFQ